VAAAHNQIAIYFTAEPILNWLAN